MKRNDKILHYRG
ncbi:hypothetical protein RVX07_002971 [Escherichia coli]|nr:hypothetical protein [Escherichia coli]EIH1668209.1 hypothetical protein [Escherichia coli O157]EIO3779453.1 hypothetical protein [Shigella flexneri]EJE8510397.1 hypothetical protein [Shigella sonnei]EKY0334927.1 hypothetical protein [Escherichia coli O2:H6]ELO0574741.1 hypothetical protein [Escherichia coli O2]ELP2971237.1 hypothetical protein [Escherichia coli O105]MBT0604641.1 hypothetical protein [Klebsiella quasipneumoniae]MBW1572264.1 hypothetical protein [Escherichia coli O25b:H4-